jgi:hypothetical protein
MPDLHRDQLVLVLLSILRVVVFSEEQRPQCYNLVDALLLRFEGEWEDMCVLGRGLIVAVLAAMAERVPRGMMMRIYTDGFLEKVHEVYRTVTNEGVRPRLTWAVVEAVVGLLAKWTEELEVPELFQLIANIMVSLMALLIGGCQMGDHVGCPPSRFLDPVARIFSEPSADGGLANRRCDGAPGDVARAGVPVRGASAPLARGMLLG